MVEVKSKIPVAMPIPIELKFAKPDTSFNKKKRIAPIPVTIPKKVPDINVILYDLYKPYIKAEIAIASGGLCNKRVLSKPISLLKFRLKLDAMIAPSKNECIEKNRRVLISEILSARFVIFNGSHECILE